MILDTSSGSQLDWFKIQDKYGKELRCPNTQGIYGNLKP